MKKMLGLAVALVACVSVTGCSYLEDRFWDATDMVDVKLMAGDGVDVSARALWFAAGAGDAHSYSLGWANRGYGTFTSDQFDAQFVFPFVDSEYNFKKVAGTIEQYGPQDAGLMMPWGPDSPSINFEKFFASGTYEQYHRVGATVQLFLGADLDLRPVEALDFILGFLTVDIREDDEGVYLEKEGS